jgi:hypothetical protein
MTPRQLIVLWLRQAKGSEAAHYTLGSRLASSSALLTVLAVGTSTVVGSSLFSVLNQSAGYRTKLALAIASASAALLVAIQRTLGLAEKAERNRQAGSGWERVRNKAAAALTLPDAELPAAVKELEALIDDLVQRSPQIPERTFTRFELDKVYSELLAAAAPPGGVPGSA